MIPENVTLIVKAPNQQIEDQNIECMSSWTVQQLKSHLSEVYPNKPRTEEQKIIYSGQLLEDTAILKDVLRTYESQIAHTMHLVCTPSRKMAEPRADEGLRRRNVQEPVASVPETVPRAETSQNQQNHTVEMQNYLNTAMNYGRVPPYPNYNLGEVPADAASMTNHMMMVQQAYMQYMQQYALWQASVRAAPADPAAAAPPPAAPAAPAAAPPPEEEEAPRDWLDNLYAASRLAILSSLVYLYGSGARLVLVLLLAVAGYLHQVGFFRDLNLNRNQNEPANQPAGNQPAGNQPAGNPNQPGGNQNQPGDNQNQPAGTPAQPDNQPNDDHRSLWSVTWMIFTTFFTSLIPEANQ